MCGVWCVGCVVCFVSRSAKRLRARARVEHTSTPRERISLVANLWPVLCSRIVNLAVGVILILGGISQFFPFGLYVALLPAKLLPLSPAANQRARAQPANRSSLVSTPSSSAPPSPCSSSRSRPRCRATPRSCSPSSAVASVSPPLSNTPVFREKQKRERRRRK